MIKLFAQALLMLMPWSLRRLGLIKIFGFKISKSARIGYSIVLPENLLMGDYSRIGHLNFITKLRLLEIGDYGVVGSLNRVTAMPRSNKDFFVKDKNRDPALIIGRHSAITNAHQIDCTDRLSIGEFSTLAGWHSQILTHAIDFIEPRQRAQSVTIGNYCFVGTRAIFLPGASLPNYSILAAGGVVHKKMQDPYTLYGGVPAAPVKSLDKSLGYFNRVQGHIY